MFDIATLSPRGKVQQMLILSQHSYLLTLQQTYAPVLLRHFNAYPFYSGQYKSRVLYLFRQIWQYCTIIKGLQYNYVAYFLMCGLYAMCVYIQVFVVLCCVVLCVIVCTDITPPMHMDIRVKSGC